MISFGVGGGKMGILGDSAGTGQPLDLFRGPRDVPTLDRLVAEHLPLVRRLSRKFSRSGEPLEDLVQVGTIGLLKAIDKYDPDRGTDFKAFAIPVILGEIKNYFRDHGWAVKVPRKIQQQKRAVEKSVDALSQRLAARLLFRRSGRTRGSPRRRYSTPLRSLSVVGPCLWMLNTIAMATATLRRYSTTWAAKMPGSKS